MDFLISCTPHYSHQVIMVMYNFLTLLYADDLYYHWQHLFHMFLFCNPITQVCVHLISVILMLASRGLQM